PRMARPVWKGHIGFGLVHVPVVLYPAEQRTDLQLHMLDSRDNARVRYERVNAETGHEVPWNTIVKGYEYSNGNYVIMSDEELKRAVPEATRTVEIQTFVKGDEIDPVYYDKPYYLEPAKGADKGYVLLREAMKESGLVGIAQVVIRTRQYIAALRPQGDVLVLNLLRYAQELRSTEDLKIPHGGIRAHGITAQEMKIARTLIDAMETPWNPEKYHDEYRAELMKWIHKRVKAGELEHPAELPDEPKEEKSPLNFMEALRNSLAQAGKGHHKAPAGRTTTPRATRGAQGGRKKAVRKGAARPTRRKAG
ncbi:MAG TPA: Ku protein, partial [Phycisphaerales bacterium]|nr:Ku protein [Phycisphaerales bacterium]